MLKMVAEERKSLFPNKVHSEVLEVRRQRMLLDDTIQPVIASHLVSTLLPELLY